MKFDAASAAEAFRAGMAARRARRDEDDCPYNDYDPLAEYWRSGWWEEDLLQRAEDEVEPDALAA